MGTVVPVHPERDIGRGLLRKRIKKLEMSREELLKHTECNFLNDVEHMSLK